MCGPGERQGSARAREEQWHWPTAPARPLEGTATHGHHALVPASPDPAQQGKAALRRGGTAAQGCSRQGHVGSVTSSLANLSDLQQAFSALMSLVSRNSRNSGLCGDTTEAQNTLRLRTLCVSGSTAAPTQGPSSQHLAVPPGVEALVENRRWVEVLACTDTVPQHQSCCCCLAQVMPCCGARPLTLP